MHTLLAWTLSGICAALLVACSGDDGEKASDDRDASTDGTDPDHPTCAGFVQMLTDCGVLTGTRLPDCPEDSPALACVVDCVQEAGCAKIEDAYCNFDQNSYVKCVTACDALKPEPMYTCADGATIPLPWRCDGAVDCAGGEDEDCPPGMFTCNNTVHIPAGWRCDGVDDCAFGEDEIDCPGEPRFDCGDGTDVSAKMECDGVDDCPGGEDEAECTRLMCE